MCEVVQSTVDERNATLMCRMTYEWQGRSRQFSQPPIFDVSLSWTGVSGTTVSSVDPTMFSGTVETNMPIRNTVLSAMSSYNCTITFNFLPGVSFYAQYALNPLSYTCQLSPVPGKCNFTNTGKYSNNRFIWSKR